MNVTEQRHRELYKQIPSFTCIKGCTDCCGPVAYTDWEWERLPDKQAQHCMDCPYSVNGGCSIYHQRPMICRLYGAVDTPRLMCPHGCGPKKKLSKEQAEALMRKYDKLNPQPRNYEVEQLMEWME